MTNAICSDQKLEDERETYRKRWVPLLINLLSGESECLANLRMN